VHVPLIMRVGSSVEEVGAGQLLPRDVSGVVPVDPAQDRPVDLDAVRKQSDLAR
jgi:hypothetical protein